MSSSETPPQNAQEIATDVDDVPNAPNESCSDDDEAFVDRPLSRPTNFRKLKKIMQERRKEELRIKAAAPRAPKHERPTKPQEKMIVGETLPTTLGEAYGKSLEQLHEKLQEERKSLESQMAVEGADIFALQRRLVEIESGSDVEIFKAKYNEFCEKLKKGFYDREIMDRIQKRHEEEDRESESVENNKKITDFFKRHISKKEMVSEGVRMYYRVMENREVRGTFIEKKKRRKKRRVEFKMPKCSGCGGTKLVEHKKDGIIVCTDCGIVSKERMYGVGFRDMESQNRPHTPYKRTNHLVEWITRVQGDERTEIPQRVIDALNTEMAKRNSPPERARDPKFIRELLRYTGYQRFFDNTAKIITILTNESVPRFEKQDIEKIRYIFDEIQAPFAKHKPKGRSNFLSYSYVLYKICELLDLDQFLPYLPLLQRPNLVKADNIWRKICEELDYEFIASFV